MNRGRALAAGLAVGVVMVLSLVSVAAAPAYRIDFSKYFGLSADGSVGQGNKLFATKCKGGVLGNWTLTAKHFILINDASSDIFVQLKMEVNLPVTTQYKKLSVNQLVIDYNDNYPDEAADVLRDALMGYFNKAKAKVNGKVTKLSFKDKGLEIAGSQVLEPSTTTAPFKPKPGC